jgi:hypothetical protein
VKCLIVEKDFYEKESKAGNIARINWYPTLYHSKILELVHEKLGQDKFMEAAEIFFGFPKDIQLGETSGLVSIVVEIAKTNKTAKKILAYLRDKNPSKYWDLKASE